MENDTTTTEYGKIGGSTVAAIVGQNPWETAHGAYLKIRREVEPTPDNVAMERGRRYEPIVANIFAGGHPMFRVEHNREGTDAPEAYVNPEYPYLVGHPDRMLFDAASGELLGGLEIKTSNIANYFKWGEEGTDAIPTNYLIQCQWYAGLAKTPEWRVAVAFLDDQGLLRVYREYNVVADAELYATLVERAVDFWENHVLPGVPPEVDAIDEATKRWIVKKYPRNTLPLEVATSDEEQLMARYLACKEAAANAQAALEKSEAALKLAIGERDGLASETYGKVTWKLSKDSTRVDYRAVCDELDPPSEVVERHTKLIEGTRRFVATGLKVKI